MINKSLEVRQPILTILLILSIALLDINCARWTPLNSSVQNIPAAGEASELSEIEVGRQIYDAITASQYIYTKPDVVEYVGEIGAKLSRQSPRPHLPYTFTILVDERLYSTAAPGGYIFLTTGLLNFCKSECELAGILAHEIGEVQRQPSIFSGIKKHADDIAAMTALIGSFFGPIGAASAAGVIFLANVPYGEIGQDLLLLEADKLAVSMMVKAGFNPAGLTNALQRFYAVSRGHKIFPLEWSQKRPVTIERLENIERTLEFMEINHEALLITSPRFAQVMQNIHEMYPSALT